MIKYMDVKVKLLYYVYISLKLVGQAKDKHCNNITVVIYVLCSGK